MGAATGTVPRRAPRCPEAPNPQPRATKRPHRWRRHLSPSRPPETQSNGPRRPRPRPRPRLCPCPHSAPPVRGGQRLQRRYCACPPTRPRMRRAPPPFILREDSSCRPVFSSCSPTAGSGTWRFPVPPLPLWKRRGAAPLPTSALPAEQRAPTCSRHQQLAAPLWPTPRRQPRQRIGSFRCHSPRSLPRSGSAGCQSE